MAVRLVTHTLVKFAHRLALFLFGLLAQPNTSANAVALPFAADGSLKMLYDNRQYPQAIDYEGMTHLAWRGKDGFPYIVTYDRARRRFSQPTSLLNGYEDQIEARKYRNDHHFAPVIWTDLEGHLHVLFGCHKTPGMHLISERPGDATRWKRGLDISESISYPKVHRVYDNKTLLYSRYSGHLGFWEYHLSDDGGNSWRGGGRPTVDLSAEPQDGAHAAYAGSYNTTAVSADGKRLHIAFIWKVEDPVFNSRYKAFLTDHTQRYNLYYLYIDLPSGRGYAIDGEEVELPLRKKTADEKCLVWDTEERVAAVGPSICLDASDQPCFVLPVSEESPLKSRFYFISRVSDEWRRSPIVETLHPFNASHLSRLDAGVYRAVLIAGEGEAVVEEGMDEYGWGPRVEEWISRDDGRSWSLSRDLTPQPGFRYQNVTFVSDNLKGSVEDMLLFYGWKGPETPGIAYLIDER